MTRKFITTIVMAIMFAISIPALAGTASAQRRNNDRNYDTQYDDQYYQDEYYDDNEYKKPNVYDRHRKVINIGVATGAGAIIGGIFGGKKGALIGAGVGVATGAIITAKQKPRNPWIY
jgi:hypothetical protein